jgi:transferase CAF17, mitochondrial
MKPFPASPLPLRAVARRSARVSFINTSRLARRRYMATETTRRASPDAPPATGFAPLPHRRFIAIAGVDAPKFLQGLVTASIYKPGAGPAEEPRDHGFYTAFLTAQGRILHDVFIHPNPEFYGIEASKDKGLPPGHSFLIEVCDSQVDALFMLMRRYKLRSSFMHRKVAPEEYSVYAYWNEHFSDIVGVPEDLSQYGFGAYSTRDSRAPDLGWRVITNGKRELKLDAQECPRDTFMVRRFLRGVAEGPDELTPDKTLPLDANMDLMGGIDFRKGCYVGQELTIRTKHRGVVRKRILPCVLYGEDEPIPQQLAYRPASSEASRAEDVPSKTDIALVGNARKRQTGTWIRGVGNIGLAMCRLQAMTDIELPGESAEAPYNPNNEFALKWEADNGKQVKVRPFVPDWIRQLLAQNANHNRPA